MHWRLAVLADRWEAAREGEREVKKTES
jgi:hypothetical protein